MARTTRLVLSRKQNENIFLHLPDGSTIKIHVSNISNRPGQFRQGFGKSVRLSLDLSEDIRVAREEVDHAAAPQLTGSAS